MAYEIIKYTAVGLVVLYGVDKVIPNDFTRTLFGLMGLALDVFFDLFRSHKSFEGATVMQPVGSNYDSEDQA